MWLNKRGASIDTLPQYDLITGEVIGDTIMQRPFDPTKCITGVLKKIGSSIRKHQ
jgi:hypothetical protein